ncbi:MAG: hypothetical protein Q9M30_03815, partial [Mariprofundaceae bacterium]|nr:hypothetical protein [Mariprofundaceae bacterium]
MSEAIVVPDFPKIRGKRNIEILRVILRVISEHGKIQQKEIDAIRLELQGVDRRLPVQTHRRLAHILTLLKDWYGIDTVVPAVPIPPPRNSILPKTAEEFAWLDGICSMTSIFWERWLGHSI